MLYILPPPRNPNPPSPWESILYGSVNNNNGNNDGTNKENSTTRSGKSLAKSTKQFHQPKVFDGLNSQNEMDPGRSSKSLSECYFAGKGTALVLPDAEASTSPQRGGEGSLPGSSSSGSSGNNQQRNSSSVTGTNIQKHLQSMFYLLRPEETLKMAVKLESIHPGRTRYLVVVSRMGGRGEESCLLGIDCNEKTTVGLVLRVLADTSIRLDGDGGFSVSVCSRHHIFKPVSVQAMWSALQTLHKISSKARELNYFQAGGLTHGWVDYYEDRIESDRSCLNEWHAMDNLESKRPPSPDSIRTKPTEREETERVIRTTLKEIMMSVDLDEVTSKYIRTRLEEELDVDLGEYKSFIDQEMLTILGQMDAPTEVFDHVYLGSEWNASNFEELRKNGVGHILNVTKEIDNFFPGTFDYLNIRVYDDEKTDLLKHWDDTFKYITKARNAGSKVLVHCKMGVSRSASVVIAYAMKAYNWDFKTAWDHVKNKRTCIKPNTAFLAQLETYRGILDAMKNREKLQRSKSETNLKKSADSKTLKILTGSEPTPIIQALRKCQRTENHGDECDSGKIERCTVSGNDLKCLGKRPKSWSPDCVAGNREVVAAISKSSPIFLSLEDLSQKSSSRESVRNLATAVSGDRRSFLPRHMLMPCDNGESYSVSPNQIVHLPGQHDFCTASVKDIINELESNSKKDERAADVDEAKNITNNTWDPGETQPNQENNANICDSKNPGPVWTSTTVLKQFKPESKEVKNADLFSNILDRVFDKEEKKQQRVSIIPVLPVKDGERECPSRQNSWSSYDSAVVLGGNQNELSRHSSWGSGDNRTLPSRNSSWGSYDIKGGEKDGEDASAGSVPWWHSGTVKRTKQKLESDSSSSDATEQETSGAILSKSIEIPNPKNVKCEKDSSRLSLSAPEPSSINLVVKECSLSRCASINGSTTTGKVQKKTDEKCSSNKLLGMVKSLKREFEAKTSSDAKVKSVGGSTSLPVSPIISVHIEKPKIQAVTSNSEDLNLKNLIGIFEGQKHANQRPKFQRNSSASHNKNSRFSCIEVSSHQFCLAQAATNDANTKTTPLIANLKKNVSLMDGEFKRPPVVRKMVAATVIATAAAKKQQQQQQQNHHHHHQQLQQYGKSHPLARLNIKPRHNSPLYNTM